MPYSIQLRAASKIDGALIDAWAIAIHADQYMSRHFPDPSRAFLWKIIRADGVDVGTIWAERTNEIPDVVFLGVLVGRTDLLGKGIGRAAVIAMIDEVRLTVGDVAIRLNVRRSNTRAIACYEKCGFYPIALKEKNRGDGIAISVVTMQWRVHTPPAA